MAWLLVQKKNCVHTFEWQVIILGTALYNIGIVAILVVVYFWNMLLVVFLFIYFLFMLIYLLVLSRNSVTSKIVLLRK